MGAVVLSGEAELDEVRCGLAAEGDVLAHYRLAKELLSRGVVHEAGERLLWCWDHGAGYKEFGSERLCKLPSTLELVGRQVPEVREEVCERLLKAEEVLSTDEAGAAAFEECVALRQAANQCPQYLELWDSLSPGARKGLSPYNELIEALTRGRRYQEALDAWGPWDFLMELAFPAVVPLSWASGRDEPQDFQSEDTKQRFMRAVNEIIAKPLAHAHHLALGLRELGGAARIRMQIQAAKLPAEFWPEILWESLPSHNWAGLDVAAEHVMRKLSDADRAKLAEMDLTAAKRRTWTDGEFSADVSFARVLKGENYVHATPGVIQDLRTPGTSLSSLESARDIDAAEYPSGLTALHVAAMLDDDAAARAILDRGADKSIKDALGRSPQDLARSDPMRLLLGGR